METNFIAQLESLKNYGAKFTKGSDFALYLQSDNDFRNLIDTLAKKFLNKQVKGCVNCFTDTYFELLNLNIKTIMEKLECNFKMRAGVVLGEDDLDNLLTHNNCTNELAIYHIAKNPNCLKYFTEVPENLDELLKKASKKTAEKAEKPSKKTAEKAEDLPNIQGDNTEAKMLEIPGLNSENKPE